jgi:F-type H+-transporting ATPase subunit b
MNINFTLVMQAISFFLFILATKVWIWPKLMHEIDTRQKQIADGLAAAEEGRHSLVNAEKRIADMMVDAKTRASDIVAQGEKLKSEAVEQARTDAKTEADRILAAAKAEIEQEVNRAKETLRAQVSQLAVAGAEKILRREVDAKAHADLLGDLQKQL